MENRRSLQTKITEGDRHKSRAIAPKPTSSHHGPTHPLLQLQRQIGNQRVTHLIQTKLKVNQPGDIYEQEADRVADSIMRIPDRQVQLQTEEEEETERAQSSPEIITPLLERQTTEEEKEEPVQMLQRQATEEKEEEPLQMLQRQSDEEDERVQAKNDVDRSSEVPPELESRIQTMRGGGQPLPESTRNFFESSLGYDLGGVRVHNDSHADEVSRSLNAQAFTIGQNVFFTAGRYEPHTNRGKWLLAHELTHVLQQNGSTVQSKSFSQDKSIAIAIENNENKTEGFEREKEIVEEKKEVTTDSDSLEGSLLKSENSVEETPQTQRILGIDLDVKQAALEKAASWAQDIPGYYLLGLIVGRDPISSKSTEPNTANLIRGVIGLIPGGDRIYQALYEAGAIDRAGAWLDKEVKKLNLIWSNIRSLFSQAWDSLSLGDFLTPLKAFEKIKKVFAPFISRIVNFARSALHQLLEFALEGALKLAGPLGEKVMGVLKQAGQFSLLIIEDPVRFLNNLIRGLKQGFENFVGNISIHLQKGLVGWLTGTLGPMGIQIPENIYSLPGIFSLVLQVLGITWNYIRAKAVKRFGEPIVTAMEKGSEIFQMLRDGGPMALWNYIKEQFSDLKEMVIDQIQATVVGQVIQSGVKWILSLLNPASALVKAALGLYEIIVFFTERASQIGDLVRAVIDSLDAIAQGALDNAAKLVENAMSNSLRVLISFFASILGIGSLPKKVREIIEKMRERTDKLIDKLLKKARREKKEDKPNKRKYIFIHESTIKDNTWTLKFKAKEEEIGKVETDPAKKFKEAIENIGTVSIDISDPAKEFKEANKNIIPSNDDDKDKVEFRRKVLEQEAKEAYQKMQANPSREGKEINISKKDIIINNFKDEGNEISFGLYAKVEKQHILLGDVTIDLRRTGNEKLSMDLNITDKIVYHQKVPRLRFKEGIKFTVIAIEEANKIYKKYRQKEEDIPEIKGVLDKYNKFIFQLTYAETRSEGKAIEATPFAKGRKQAGYELKEVSTFDFKEVDLETELLQQTKGVFNMENKEDKEKYEKLEQRAKKLGIRKVPDIISADFKKSR